MPTEREHFEWRDVGYTTVEALFLGEWLSSDGVRTCRLCAEEIPHMDVACTARSAYSGRTAKDVVQGIDATVEGRCASTGCGILLTTDSPSGWWCSPECQAAYQAQGAIRPHEVRGSRGVAEDAARWRPDLESDLAVFDAAGLQLVTVRPVGGQLVQRTYRRAGSDVWWFRLDDGHRFVGLDVAPEVVRDREARQAVWDRLERELTDPRRLDPEPPTSLAMLASATEQATTAAGSDDAEWRVRFNEAMRRAVAAELGGRQDRLTLRVVCSDEDEYERALQAARDHGLTVREVAEMLAAGQSIGDRGQRVSRHQRTVIDWHCRLAVETMHPRWDDDDFVAEGLENARRRLAEAPPLSPEQVRLQEGLARIVEVARSGSFRELQAACEQVQRTRNRIGVGEDQAEGGH